MKANESRSLLGTWSAMKNDSSAYILHLKSVSISNVVTSQINPTTTLILRRTVVQKDFPYLAESRNIFFSGT